MRRERASSARRASSWLAPAIGLEIELLATRRGGLVAIDGEEIEAIADRPVAA
jgi:hypothetical protein